MTTELGRSVFSERTFVCLLLLIMQAAIGQESSIGSNGGVSLQDVIILVWSNEEKLTLVKMNCVVVSRREGQKPDYAHSHPMASRTASPIDREEIEWAQDGIRQRFVRRGFSDKRPSFSEISVVDGEVTKSGDWPELTSGTIEPVSGYNRWMANSVSQLFYRPCSTSRDDWPLLSEWLGSQSLGSGPLKRELNGTDVFVVDTSSGMSGRRRFYIGCDTGLLMRLETYGGDPDNSDSKLLGLGEVTKAHQLSNGGWVPLEGRIVHYGDGYTGFRDVHVDVNSISVDRADIPDSLFRLDYPEHTKVFNTILGYDAAQLDRIAAAAIDSKIDDITMADTREDGNKAGLSRTSVDHGNEASDLPRDRNAPQSVESTKTQEDLDRPGSMADSVWRTGKWLGLFLVAAGASAFVLMTWKKREKGRQSS